ncbi:MAG: T9SS type A sorting domain-containing protein [Bacteroidetes bacterium]|nr:T9SS type A sorting domain-containing protein [Bacteroidota bacterium]
MKNFILPLLFTACSVTAFAQAAKPTAAGDTLYYYNNTYAALIDSSVAFPSNTGYLLGTNSYGDSAFAEMFDFTGGNDTAVSVMGLISYWSGNVSAATGDSLTFRIWGIDTTSYQLDTNVYVANFPGGSLGSKKVALTALNIAGNQPITTWFDAPVTGINGNFYAGYSYSYDPDSITGRSIGLHSTDTGKGQHLNHYQLRANGDTVFTPRNAILESNGYWYDLNKDLGKKINLSIIPIYHLQHTTGVGTVSNQGLSLLGNYPNPATESTNIRFSLARSSDVTVQLMNATGKLLNTFNESGLTPGEHSIALPLTGYPSGNYIYILHTGAGTMAAAFSISK